MERNIIPLEYADLCKLAEEKGFKPKVLTTSWTFDQCLGKKDLQGLWLNEVCLDLLLEEIKGWLRKEHKIFMNVIPDNEDNILCWSYTYINKYDDYDHEDSYSCGSTSPYPSYREALEEVLEICLKLLP
jgi:hypothetical protein